MENKIKQISLQLKLPTNKSREETKLESQYVPSSVKIANIL